MPPKKQFSTYFPATAANGVDLYRLERLVELRKPKQSSINKSDIIRNAFAFYYAAQPELAVIEAELGNTAPAKTGKVKNPTTQEVAEKLAKFMASKAKAADPA